MTFIAGHNGILDDGSHREAAENMGLFPTCIAAQGNQKERKEDAKEGSFP